MICRVGQRAVERVSGKDTRVAGLECGQQNRVLRLDQRFSMPLCRGLIALGRLRPKLVRARRNPQIGHVWRDLRERDKDIERPSIEMRVHVVLVPRQAIATVCRDNGEHAVVDQRRGSQKLARCGDDTRMAQDRVEFRLRVRVLSVKYLRRPAAAVCGFRRLANRPNGLYDALWHQVSLEQVALAEVLLDLIIR